MGRRGEEVAARFLRDRGWRILARNERVGRRELDLVVRKGGVVAFVEVKCRADREFGDPLEAITPRKRFHVARAAAEWLRARGVPRGVLVRFDAVRVIWPSGGAAEVTHIPDAWRME